MKKIKDIRINDASRINIYDRAAVERKKRQIRKAYKPYFKNQQMLDKWEGTLEAVNYMLFDELLDLKPGEYYVEFNNGPTFMWCESAKDIILLIHNSVTEVNLHGDKLTVYCSGMVQQYCYNEKLELFDKKRQRIKSVKLN